MPPNIKVTREAIIENAYEIAVEKGLSGVNARSVAKRLNCSIQPIFSNFKTMNDLKDKVIEKSHATYSQYITNAVKEERPYKAMGKNYIRFAKDYPKLFQLLFMSDVHVDSTTFLKDDVVGQAVYLHGKQATKLDKEKMKQFHFKVWIFTHGIATLCATNTCDFSDDEIDALLKEIFNSLLKEYGGTE